MAITDLLVYEIIETAVDKLDKLDGRISLLEKLLTAEQIEMKDKIKEAIRKTNEI